MEGCVPQRTHWSECPRLHFCPAVCTDFLAVEKIIFQLLSVWPAWRWCGFHLERENISGLHPIRFSPFCTCNMGEHVFTCVGDTPGRPNSTVSSRLKVNTHSPSSGTFSHMPLPQTKPRYRSMCERGLVVDAWWHHQNRKQNELIERDLFLLQKCYRCFCLRFRC